MTFRIPGHPAISNQTAGNARIIVQPMDGYGLFLTTPCPLKHPYFFKTDRIKSGGRPKTEAVGAEHL
jgi:hypothetical protein